MYTNLREYLENSIDNCRVKENAVRRAFVENGDYLWIQLGGPIIASKIRLLAREDRLRLQSIYEKVFGEHYAPHAFNEF